MSIRTYAGTPSNGTDEVQTVTVTGSPGGGTYKLRFRGATTGTIAHDAASATVQTALRALSTIGSGGCSVSGSAGGPYTVTFTGDLAKKNQPMLQLTANALTGGTSPSVSIAETTAGVDATRRNAAQEDYLLDTVTGTLYANTGTEPVAQWTPATPQLSADVQLTNNQVKALRATPIELVPAPAAGLALILDAVYMDSSAAAGAWTESSDDLVVEYGDGTDILTVETTGFIDGAAVRQRYQRPDQSTAAVSLVAASKLQLKNSGDGEFGGGNAANTLSVRTYYRVVPTVAFS